MDDFERKMKEMEEVPFPENLHRRIMRRVLFLKFRVPFVILFLLLTVNLTISALRLQSQMEGVDSSIGFFLMENRVLEFYIERDILALPAVEAFPVLFSDLFSLTIDFLPITAMVSLLINLLLVGFIGTMFVRLKKVMV